MKTIVALLLSCLCARAADHVITWGFNPADQFIMGYIVHEQIGGVWQRRAEVSGAVNTVTISNVTAGLHVYSLSATNVSGEGPKSIPINAIVPNLPSAPTNIIVNLRASIEKSSGPGAPWSELLAIAIPLPAAEASAIYRIRQTITR
jgi:hypothetical protein